MPYTPLERTGHTTGFFPGAGDCGVCPAAHRWRLTGNTHMSILPKLHITEEFARFFEAPTRADLRDLLHRQSGEYDFLDFKETWPERSELARHILAFANSGNGCIVVGVAEREDKTFECKGRHTLEDKTALKDVVQKFLPETVAYEILDFEYADSEYQQLKGKKFQLLLVAHNPDVVPILSLADGTSVERNRIYVRHNNSSRGQNILKSKSLSVKELNGRCKPPGVVNYTSICRSWKLSMQGNPRRFYITPSRPSSVPRLVFTGLLTD